MKEALRFNGVELTEDNIKKMTENSIQKIGFELVRRYKHDEFNTNKYKKGCIEIEFTYEGKSSAGVDVKLGEMDWRTFYFNEVVKLDELLNK